MYFEIKRKLFYNEINFLSVTIEFLSKSKPNFFKATVKLEQQCLNISILLWQHVLVVLNHLQTSIQRYEVQSVHIMYCGFPYYLQGVYKKQFKIRKIKKKNICTPYILIIKANKMHYLSNLFCYRTVHVSDRYQGSQHCVHIKRHLSCSYVDCVLAKSGRR